MSVVACLSNEKRGRGDLACAHCAGESERKGKVEKLLFLLPHFLLRSSKVCAQARGSSIFNIVESERKCISSERGNCQVKSRL